MATKPDRPTRKVKGGSVLGNDWEKQAREKIQASGVVNRLIGFVKGEVSLESAQVTAGVALMRKVLPDVVFIEHSGDVTTTKVIRTPTIAPDIASWQREHAKDTLQ